MCDGVSVKDRQAWLSIFARYNIVEDPVGSAPHVSGILDCKTGIRGNGPLQRFYDNFFEPNKIVFHVENDVVSCGRVLRDLDIEITMSTGLNVSVPMHLIYELVEEKGFVPLTNY